MVVADGIRDFGEGDEESDHCTTDGSLRGSEEATLTVRFVSEQLIFGSVKSGDVVFDIFGLGFVLRTRSPGIFVPASSTACTRVGHRRGAR